MKLSNLLVIVPAIFISYQAAAQQTYVHDSRSLGHLYTRRAPSEKATGSQYFIENFSPAKINNSTEVNIVRYNAYSDELEVKINDEIMVLQPDENRVIQLVRENIAYQYLPYKDKENKPQQSYLILLADTPNLKLYKRERVHLQPEVHPTGGYQKYKAPAYKKLDPEYYVKVNNGDIVYLSTNKSDIMAKFSAKEKEIKAFIKENKIKTSDETDLVKLATFIGSAI